MNNVKLTILGFWPGPGSYLYYSHIIYADIESLIKKIDGCANNPEKSSTTKIGEHIHCGYSMSATWGFDHIEENILYIL